MADETHGAAAPRRTFAQALAAYGERPTLVMLLLGFSSGLPYLLIFDTLSLWLREAGLSLSVIAFFSLATLAYAFKFLWAPLVDRTRIPVLTKLLGHRRSWMLVVQVIIMVALFAISGLNPATNLAAMAAVAVAIGFAGGTQDIAMDAWRIEAAETEKQGVMAAAYQWGYRVAQITAGAAPLLLAEAYSWNLSYAVMAGLMLAGMLGVVLAPREKQHVIRPIPTEGIDQPRAFEVGEWLIRAVILAKGALIMGSGLAGDATILSQLLAPVIGPEQAEAFKTAWSAKPNGVWLQLGGVLVGLAIIVVSAWPLPGVRTKPGAYLSTAFGEPLADFFKRFSGVAGLILALICLYRLPDFVLNIMNPFYSDLGFTKVEIAEIRKVFGVVMTSIGIFVGGLSVARWGIMRTLLAGALAGPISNLVFAWLTTQGPSLQALMVAIAIDNVATGLAGTALIAYMSSLTGAGFTATQYALFSSLYALPGRLVASQSGRIVESAAGSAEQGGSLAPLKSLMAGAPPETLAAGAQKAGVSPAALGAGYITFFLYSAIIGVVAIVLTVLVARKTALLAEKKAAEEPQPSENSAPAS